MAFAGHRPEKLPWGQNESDPRCAALKIQILRAVEQASDRGVTTFLCGMARGCDFYFAEAVLALKASGRDAALEAYLPCPSQPDFWPEEDRHRYQQLLTRCDAVYMMEPEFSEGCMLRRNRAMAERCDVLLTVYDGSSGGTAAAIRYARQIGKKLESLWL